MQNLKSSLDCFAEELKKDLVFFGGAGAAVAILMLWQGRIKELGWAINPTWSQQILTDFISLNAFALILFGYLFIGSLANLLADIGFEKPKLEQAVFHIESRLAQFTSSICTFLAGLILVVAGESILNIDFTGFKLVAFALLFVTFIGGCYLIALMVCRRTQPFNTWWASIGLMILVIWMLISLLLQSNK